MITYKQLTEGITKPVPMGVIVKAMEPARSKIVGKPITPANVAKATEKVLGKKFNLVVTLKFVTKLQSGDMSAGAYYDQDAELEGDPSIEIILLFSSEDKKGIEFTNEGFDGLAADMARVVVHEMLHKTQAKTRGYVEPRPFTATKMSDPKIAKAQEYFGKSDEIEGYGHNIAVDLLRSYGSRKNALTALRNFVSIPKDKSPDLNAYLVVFGMDKNHPVLKKLVKKVILFLKRLEEDRLMLTFKEYILLEDRVNWNEYGSWINSKTRKVLEVEPEQHENDMDEYIKKNHPKIFKKSKTGYGEYDKKHDLANEWALDNGWVRLVHSGAAMSIQGSIKNIKKIWRMIAKNAMKLMLYIDLDGKSQPFDHDTFDMTNPKQRNKWLKHM